MPRANYLCQKKKGKTKQFLYCHHGAWCSRNESNKYTCNLDRFYCKYMSANTGSERKSSQHHSNFMVVGINARQCVARCCSKYFLFFSLLGTNCIVTINRTLSLLFHRNMWVQCQCLAIYRSSGRQFVHVNSGISIEPKQLDYNRSQMMSMVEKNRKT